MGVLVLGGRQVGLEGDPEVSGQVGGWEGGE